MAAQRDVVSLGVAKRLHAASRASGEELIGILDHLPAMIAFWGQDLHNKFANHAYIEWFGMDPAQMLGVHIKDVLGPTVFAMNLSYIEGVLAGEPQLFERTLIDTHGTTRYTQATYTPHVVDGRVDGFYALITDISERVQAETALRESAETMTLLRERERISEDLHDLVIQRLFAAGRDVAIALSADPDGVSAERMESAIEGIDDTIKELRASIYGLRRGLRPTEFAASVERIMRQATRTLQFPPTLTYAGSVHDMPAAVSSGVLAVLNEALTNAAKHAAATRIDVTIAFIDSHVSVRVADDGRGIDQLTRSSGITNMRSRAERLGGTFTHVDNTPTGTIIEWTVPTQPPADWPPRPL